MADYGLCIARADKMGEAIMVLTTIRATYTQMKKIQALVARFSSDQEFSDMFDQLMTSDGFDGTVFISQMLYQINQTATAWEANADYRDVLGLVPAAV